MDLCPSAYETLPERLAAEVLDAKVLNDQEHVRN